MRVRAFKRKKVYTGKKNVVINAPFMKNGLVFFDEDFIVLSVRKTSSLKRNGLFSIAKKQVNIEQNDLFISFTLNQTILEQYVNIKLLKNLLLVFQNLEEDLCAFLKPFKEFMEGFVDALYPFLHL